MNLQPLFDLKERLEHTAVAGTGLLDEDFRLKRARESLTPLAAASPVFGKITAGVDALFAAPQETRGGALLDVLALVDAVVYTQGSTGCQGDLSPLPTDGVGTLRPLSYGQLHPLLEALTGTGSGRFSLVADIRKEHPEYFSDYRVLPALIEGLGDGYADMADQNAGILKEQGEKIIPLLKEGFDPEGKGGMVRRVRLIQELAGEKENDFYLAQLPQSKKEVRTELIRALCHDSHNTPLLLELCQTEKRGESRDCAHEILVKQETPEVEEYFLALGKKNPVQAFTYLLGEKTAMASRLTAAIAQEQIKNLRTGKKLSDSQRNERFRALFLALIGKTGPGIADIYREAVELFGEPEGKGKKPGIDPLRDLIFYTASPSNPSQPPFAVSLPYVLAMTVMGRGDRELCDLAVELYEREGGAYLVPAFAAQLLIKDSAESYEWAKERLFKREFLKKTVQEDCLSFIRYVLMRVKWNREENGYRFMVRASLRNEWEMEMGVPVPCLDVRWFELLAQLGKDMDDALAAVLSDRQEIPGLSKLVVPYIYQEAISTLSVYSAAEWIRILNALGWERWENFVVQYFLKQGQVSFPECMTLLNTLPVPPKEKAAQLRKMDELVRNKKINLRHNYWEENMAAARIHEWENQPSGEETSGS